MWPGTCHPEIGDDPLTQNERAIRFPKTRVRWIRHTKLHRWTSNYLLFFPPKTIFGSRCMGGSFSSQQTSSSSPPPLSTNKTVFSLGPTIDSIFGLRRRTRMCQLWRHLDASVEEGRHRPLPVQRLRSLLQDERTESATHQTQTETGTSHILTRFDQRPPVGAAVP